VIADGRGASKIEFPSDLEIVITREFKAPLQLVWDVLTESGHMRKTFAPFGETITVFDLDFRVGGEYHFVFVTDDGIECSFRGRFLEIEPPTRSVQTWLFDGWPDADAVESIELTEADGVTILHYRLVFSDQAGRDHMSTYDGLLANFDNVENLVMSLLASD
jgi:uncharacterized protein YndB with AHSA1/START domain